RASGLGHARRREATEPPLHTSSATRSETGRLVLRRALAGVPLPRASDGRLVLAVDVSPWLRPDADTCSDRSFCHTFGRGLGKHQMVPGWPYSIVAALETGRTLWTALLDAIRLRRRRRRGVWRPVSGALPRIRVPKDSRAQMSAGDRRRPGMSRSFRAPMTRSAVRPPGAAGCSRGRSRPESAAARLSAT
ncbi:transposase, partial [Streptomyces sp. NPDC097981]|uniref:transposase n=1 Tax=Streptomyces sp. NPDC097981 TaxID=3155428 RepID=UPI00332DCFAA